MRKWISVFALLLCSSGLHAEELIPVEQQILDATNKARVEARLTALAVDPGLQETCRQHCAWMATHQIFRHGRFGVAENIAMGPQEATGALRMWLNSAGHRANILNRNHTRIGVAAYTAPNGQVYWCQQFAGGPVRNLLDKLLPEPRCANGRCVLPVPVVAIVAPPETAKAVKPEAKTATQATGRERLVVRVREHRLLARFRR